MSRTKLSQSADIFIRQTNKKSHITKHAARKSFGTLFKTTGIIASMGLLFFGINFAALTVEKVDKQVADPASTIGQTKTLFDMVPKPAVPSFNQVNLASAQIPQAAPAIASPQNNTYTPYYNTPNFNTPNFVTPINTTPINTTPINTTPNTFTDVTGSVSQIIQMQNQIAQQMQACMQLTQQAQGQVGQMRAQVAQFDAQVQSINTQLTSVNVNDPNSQAIRNQLSQQRDQLQFQRMQLNNAVSQVRNQYYTSKSNCQNQVSALQTQKRNVETQLNTSFNQTLNTNIL
jgi:hypothetical protein